MCLDDVPREPRVCPLEKMIRELLHLDPLTTAEHGHFWTVWCACPSVCVYALLHSIKLWLDHPPAPSPRDKKYKNTETWHLKFKKKKKKLSAIIFYGGEVDMSAQWDPTSNKDQHFFHCFLFWWRWAWSKDQKSKIAFKFWYVYGSVTFFLFSFFFFSLRPFCISVRVCTDREGRFNPPVYPSVCLSICLSVHPCVWTCCVGCLHPVPGSCFLSVSGRGHSRKHEQYAGQAGTVIWLCTHSWSVHGFQQTAALFPKV